MRMSRELPAKEIAGKIVRETEKAIQLKLTDHKHFGNTAPWFPLSQVLAIHREAKTKGVDRLVVSSWIYQQKLEEVGVSGDNGFSEPDEPDEETFDSLGVNPND